VYIKKPLKQVKRGFEVEILLKFFSLVEPVTYFGTPPVDPAGRCVKSFGLNCLGLRSSRMARSGYHAKRRRILFSFFSWQVHLPWQERCFVDFVVEHGHMWQ